jgi:thiosulfate/3-mercaptopyruvate sulfurtransferase
LLHDPASLKAALEKSNPTVVVDTRNQEAYAAGHIPGARWIDINVWRETTLTETGLTDTKFWTEQLGALGLTAELSIVVVGDALPEAARVWWLLRYVGMPKVAVLDGGQAAWVEAGLEVTTDLPEFTPTQPKSVFQSEQLAGIDLIVDKVIEQQQCTLLDTRSTAEFTGTRGVGTRTGHIPGATHLDWNEFVDSTGKLLMADEIKQRLKDAGVDLTQPIVAHCQTGGRSSVAVLALELAGVRQSKNYYRGWSEYSETLTAPVEK